MRGVPPLLLVCLGVAAAGLAQPAAPRVYGVEIDATGGDHRVRVLADGEIEATLEAGERRSVVLLPGATLDAAVPKALRGERGSPVSRVTLLAAPGTPPEVRVVVQHRAGLAPTLSRSGDQIALVFPAPRPQAREPAARTLPIRMINANFRDAVTRIAEFLGLTVLIGDELRGRVSIDAPAPVTEREARALLDSLLLLRGFALLPTPGGILKVITLAEAQPGFSADASTIGAEDEAPLVTLIALEQIEAALVEQAVRPLVASTGLLLPLPDDRRLIVGGPAHRVRRLVEVIRALDATGPRKLVILELAWASAETLEEMLLEAFAQHPDVEVWADTRTNRLLVRGRPDHVEDVRRFVVRADRPAATRGGIQVLPLRYADLDRMVEILTTLQTGDAVSDARLSERTGAGLAGRAFSVSAHRPSHALVVQADPTTFEWVRDVVTEIDRIPARIEVELTIAEVTIADSLTLAFDALLPLVEPDAPDDLIAALVMNPSADSPTGNPLLPPPAGGTSLPLLAQITRAPIVIPVVDPVTGQMVDVLVPRGTGAITAGADETEVRVLLKPRLSLLSGEEHELFAGDNVPIRMQQADVSDPLETRQNIERRDVGLRLRVEPTMGEQGVAILGLDLEVSQLSAAGGQDATVVGPAIRQRRLQSTARLHPGEMAVLAFVSAPAQQRSVVGTPFLKDIPGLGWLFRRQRETTVQSHLIVLARASVERPEAEVLGRWLRDALDRQPGEETAPVPRS